MSGMAIKSERTVTRFVKSYIKENRLPYTVKVRRREGIPTLVIASAEPTKKLRARKG
jgi:hypothetical protein